MNMKDINFVGPPRRAFKSGGLGSGVGHRSVRGF